MRIVTLLASKIIPLAETCDKQTKISEWTTKLKDIWMNQHLPNRQYKIHDKYSGERKIGKKVWRAKKNAKNHYMGCHSGIASQATTPYFIRSVQ